MLEIIYNILGLIGAIQVVVIIMTFFFALGYVLNEKKIKIKTVDLFWSDKITEFWKKILRQFIK